MAEFSVRYGLKLCYVLVVYFQLVGFKSDIITAWSLIDLSSRNETKMIQRGHNVIVSVPTPYKFDDT